MTVATSRRVVTWTNQASNRSPTVGITLPALGATWGKAPQPSHSPVTAQARRSERQKQRGVARRRRKPTLVPCRTPLGRSPDDHRNAPPTPSHLSCQSGRSTAAREGGVDTHAARASARGVPRPAPPPDRTHPCRGRRRRTAGRLSPAELVAQRATTSPMSEGEFATVRRRAAKRRQTAVERLGAPRRRR